MYVNTWVNKLHCSLCFCRIWLCAPLYFPDMLAPLSYPWPLQFENSMLLSDIVSKIVFAMLIVNSQYHTFHWGSRIFGPLWILCKSGLFFIRQTVQKADLFALFQFFFWGGIYITGPNGNLTDKPPVNTGCATAYGPTFLENPWGLGGNRSIFWGRRIIFLFLLRPLTKFFWKPIVGLNPVFFCLSSVLLRPGTRSLNFQRPEPQSFRGPKCRD